MKHFVEFMIFLVAAIFFVVAIFQTILFPLAPIFTTLFVVALTAFTLKKKGTAILAVAGLLLYGISWLVAEAHGPLPGVTVWALGLLSWAVAVYLSFQRLTKSWATD